MSHTIQKWQETYLFDKEGRKLIRKRQSISYDELDLQTKYQKLRCSDFCFHYDHMNQTCHIEGSQLKDICPFFFCTWHHEKLK